MVARIVAFNPPPGTTNGRRKRVGSGVWFLGKAFFFEKKKQKTFDSAVAPSV